MSPRHKLTPHLFSEYVVKPFVVRDLLGKINKLLDPEAG
jgi:hypothetical protein